MQLVDVDNLLNTSYVGATNEAVFEARLDAAKDQAKTYCNRSFVDDAGNEAIPKGAQMGIALIVKAMGENQNVQSQSLGDMSKSFFEGATYRSALGYLKPYRKASFK